MIGAAAMLDGMVERMEEELGAPGEGHRDRGHLPGLSCRTAAWEMHYDKDLLLKGLITLYHNNARQKPKAARD